MDDMALLHKKLDYLTEQMDVQRRRQESIEAFMQDFSPVANQMFHLSVHELDEIGEDFTLEDVLFLLKRLLRDTRKFTGMLDQLDSLIDLSKEIGMIGKPMVDSAIEQLNGMEQRGYFTFAEGAQYVIERIVTEFDENDIKALGDNIVTILQTIRNMTQPDVMQAANTMIDSLRAEEIEDVKVSTWALFREFNDPSVRKGLMKMLHAVKTLSAQPENMN